MTSATNPNLSIFKTLISLNAGQGCPDVKTNTASNYLSGNELALLESRVRIYKKRKAMYGKTDAAITVLQGLAALVKDDPSKDSFAQSNATSNSDQKKEVEDKLKKYQNEFRKEYQTLVDEDDDAKPIGGIGYDVRAKQGLAPAVSGGPFKNSDRDLILALGVYKLDQGAYDTVDKLLDKIKLFDNELAILLRISPEDEESLLTKFNFNPWDRARNAQDGLSEITLARQAREATIRDYENAFNRYNPQSAAAKQTKINTYVNPAKKASDAVGTFPQGVSGMDIIHSKDDATLQADTLVLENLQSALNQLVGGINAASDAYKNEFGSNPKVLAQIAGAQSSADISTLAAKRRNLIADLTKYMALGTDFKVYDDAELKLEIDERKAIFEKYYRAYDEAPDITFQQNADINEVQRLTAERVDLNKRAEKAMNNTQAKGVQTAVGDDNVKYKQVVEDREKMVKEYLDLGGKANPGDFKDLTNPKLQDAIDERKLLIDASKSLFVNQPVVIDDIKKKENSKVKLANDARELLLQAVSKRGLNGNNDSASKSDTVLNDEITKNDDKYNETIRKITLFSGIAKTGDAASNSPTLKNLLDEAKVLEDARKLLLGQAKALGDAGSPDLDINGKKLKNVIAEIDNGKLSNSDIENKIKEIETVSQSTSIKVAYESKLDTLEANTASTGQLVKGISTADTVKAEQEAMNLRRGFEQTRTDAVKEKSDIQIDSQLDGPAKADLVARVDALLQLIEDNIIELAVKDQEIIDAKNNIAAVQQRANRIRDYEAIIESQNLQSSLLRDEFGTVYETETKYAEEMLGEKLNKDILRINGLKGIEAQEAGAFVDKLKELESGTQDFAPGEEISITIQSLSNFDAIDSGAFTGDSSKSQRTAFATEMKRQSKTIQLLEKNDANAPFVSLDLGWEEKNQLDSLFISSWARIVPNRKTSESKKRLESMGLEWLTETLYVDMLDRSRVYNYNGFLRHYIDLLNKGENKDVAKRAEYTDDQGNPIVCAIALPGNTTLGGVFGVPVDKVTVGVAQGDQIEYLVAPSVNGLIPEIKKSLIEAGATTKTRTFPNMDERRDINNILKTFFIEDGKGVKATPTAVTLDIEDDAQNGFDAWKDALEEDNKELDLSKRRHLLPGSKAKNAYDSKFYEEACAEAMFATIQREVLDVAKIKLRFHRIQKYNKMTNPSGGANVKDGIPYLNVQCANVDNYCVLIKDNRSLKFDFLDEARKLYIFNMNGTDLRKHNDGIKVAVAAASNPPQAQQLLDTDDEDVSNFRFIPNI